MPDRDLGDGDHPRCLRQVLAGNSYDTETYVDATPSAQKFSELRLAAHSYPFESSAIGFMFGSTNPTGAGRSFATEIPKQRPWLSPRSVERAVVPQAWFPPAPGASNSTLWYQNLGSSTMGGVYSSMRFHDYVPTSAGCLTTPASSKGRVDGGWHSFMCPLPTDGKVVWHHMNSWLVAEGHGLCALGDMNGCKAKSAQTVSYSLPARAGGHVFEGIQVVDDDNNLAAMVSLETSLYSQKSSSQSQLALFAVMSR